MDTRAATSLTRELFWEHGAAVYRFAVALGRHPQDAEDVVQETWLRAATALKRHGFERVNTLGGGLMSWESASLPLARK